MRKIQFLFASLICVIIVGGCNQSNPQLASVGATPRPTAQIKPAVLKTAEKLSPVFEITLEREPGMIDNPQWLTLTIKRDGIGTRVYSDISRQRDGTYKGKIAQKELDSLLHLIERSNFIKFKPAYSSTTDDIPVDTFSIVINGKRKTVEMDDWGDPLNIIGGAKNLAHWKKENKERAFLRQIEKEHQNWQFLQQIRQKLLLIDKNTNWVKISNKKDMPHYQPDFNHAIKTLKAAMRAAK